MFPPSYDQIALQEMVPTDEPEGDGASADEPEVDDASTDEPEEKGQDYAMSIRPPRRPGGNK